MFRMFLWFDGLHVLFCCLELLIVITSHLLDCCLILGCCSSIISLLALLLQCYVALCQPMVVLKLDCGVLDSNTRGFHGRAGLPGCC